MSDCKRCPKHKTTGPPGVLVEYNDTSRTPSKDYMVSTLDGFPEHKNVRYSSRWVIYTGGPPEAHLFGINDILPPEANRVSIDREGRLEYEKGPDDFEPPGPIDGFCRDKKNDHFFLPVWKSCVWRHFSISFKLNCRCIDILARCGKSSQLTDYAKCEQCGDRMEIPVMVVPEKKTLSSLQYPEGLPIHNSKLRTHGTT